MSLYYDEERNQMSKTIVIIGTSGAIGSALLKLYCSDRSNTVFGFSRQKHTVFKYFNLTEDQIDILNEGSIDSLVKKYFSQIKIDILIIATGLLHTDKILPEKSLRDVSLEKFQAVFAANTIGPALIFKYFSKLLPNERRGIMAVISARVGSISDNQLGGWYSYRASKAALNMVVKNASIEVRRKFLQGIVVGLHPGTVMSKLSKPFQSNIPRGKLFSSNYAAAKLKEVVDRLELDDNGKCLDFNGGEILP